MTYLKSYLALLNSVGQAFPLSRSATAEDMRAVEAAISEGYDPLVFELARARKAPQPVIAAGPKACDRYTRIAVEYERLSIVKRPAELMREVVSVLRREEGLDSLPVREASVLHDPNPTEAQAELNQLLAAVGDFHQKRVTGKVVNTPEGRHQAIDDIALLLHSHVDRLAGVGADLAQAAQPKESGRTDVKESGQTDAELRRMKRGRLTGDVVPLAE